MQKESRLLAMLSVAAMLFAAPASAYEQKKDSVADTKTENDRNVLLNASSADQPRQIDVGLPTNVAAYIFNDDLPESYALWPSMPYFSWFGGTSMKMVTMKTLSEGALLSGNIGYVIDSKTKGSTDKFSGDAGYEIGTRGRHTLSATVTGPIGKGWGYLANIHQVWDRGTQHSEAFQWATRAQQYKIGIDKHFNGKRGYMGLLYNYAQYSNPGGLTNYSPFIYNGDGSVSKYNGINYGTDAYWGSQSGSFTYKDVRTGEIKTISASDAYTTKTHQLTYQLKYDFGNDLKLDVVSKMRLSDAGVGYAPPTGVVANNGGYLLADGSAYTGDYVQNRWLVLCTGYERSWMTNAFLYGKSADKRHSWRVGLNNWYDRHNVVSQANVMQHTVEADPATLYVNRGTLSDVTAYNPGYGEFYDGHEHKIALVLSDDWQAARKLWLSAGVRLEYQAYAGHGYLAEDKDGNVIDANNYRSAATNLTNEWYAGANGGKAQRFTGDYLNPSATFNVRYNVRKNWGFVGEYVYIIKHRTLTDYGTAYAPVTKASNVHFARAGIFWNTPYFQFTSQASYITQSTNIDRTTFYNTKADGTEESTSLPVVYGVKTLGWTNDIVLTPFRNFSLHMLTTLQKPQYKDFTFDVDFESGATKHVDVSGNQITAMSKFKLEIDPSYTWNKFRFGLNFRYFSKQYINKTNTLYFNGWWESFANVNYQLNKHIGFGVQVVNFLNVTGATGSISSADLANATEAAGYNNYLMAGSYLRPFQINVSANIRF